MINGQIKWPIERCIKDAKKYKSKNEWAKAPNSGYDAASSNGWLDQCCRHMVCGRTKWNLEKCIKEAKKYKTKKQWQTAPNSGYTSAYLNKWLKKCYAHMPEFANHNRKEEKLARPKYLKLFKKHNICFTEQFKLGSKKIDFILTIKNKKIGVEIKHDDLKHSYTEKQIKTYKRLGNLKQYNLSKVILSSPKGRHGVSIKELESIIKSLK